MKVSDLSGCKLNKWVAKAAGYTLGDDDAYVHANGDHIWVEQWMPTTDWGQGGRVLEDNFNKIMQQMRDWHGNLWYHKISNPLVLREFMRALVASKYGEDIADEI